MRPRWALRPRRQLHRGAIRHLDAWVGKPKHDMFWSFGLGGGLTFWTETSPFGTNTAIGSALPPGYNFQLRTSVEFLPWLALDLRGMNMHNAGNSIVDGGKLTGWGGLFAGRFTLPLKHIKPYALIGLGRHHFSASGDGTLFCRAAPTTLLKRGSAPSCRSMTTSRSDSSTSTIT